MIIRLLYILLHLIAWTLCMHAFYTILHLQEYGEGAVWLICWYIYYKEVAINVQYPDEGTRRIY